MIPDYNPDGSSWVCLGFPILQNRHAVPFWSYVLTAQKPTDIIEIGTWEGGFTSLLAVAARNLEARVHTFGREEINPRSQWWFTQLGITFYRGDVFEEKSLGALIKICSNAKGPLLVLCDGGDKAREFKMCAPLLKKGDIIAAHDLAGPTWPKSEITEEMVKGSCDAYGLEPYLPEDAALAGWLVKHKTA